MYMHTYHYCNTCKLEGCGQRVGCGWSRWGVGRGWGGQRGWCGQIGWDMGGGGGVLHSPS